MPSPTHYCTTLSFNFLNRSPAIPNCTTVAPTETQTFTVTCVEDVSCRIPSTEKNTKTQLRPRSVFPVSVLPLLTTTASTTPQLPSYLPPLGRGSPPGTEYIPSTSRNTTSLLAPNPSNLKLSPVFFHCFVAACLPPSLLYTVYC